MGFIGHPRAPATIEKNWLKHACSSLSHNITNSDGSLTELSNPLLKLHTCFSGVLTTASSPSCLPFWSDFQKTDSLLEALKRLFKK